MPGTRLNHLSDDSFLARGQEVLERAFWRKVHWIIWYHLSTNRWCLKITCCSDLAAYNPCKGIVLQVVLWKMQIHFKIHREVNLVLSVGMPLACTRFELSEGTGKLCTNNKQFRVFLWNLFLVVPISCWVQNLCNWAFWLKRKHSRGKKVNSLQVIFRAFFCQLGNDRTWECVPNCPDRGLVSVKIRKRALELHRDSRLCQKWPCFAFLTFKIKEGNICRTPCIKCFLLIQSLRNQSTEKPDANHQYRTGVETDTIPV